MSLPYKNHAAAAAREENRYESAAACRRFVSLWKIHSRTRAGGGLLFTFCWCLFMWLLCVNGGVSLYIPLYQTTGCAGQFLDFGLFLLP